MKCELCHSADAQQAIRKLVADEEQEFYVCKACAQAQQLLPKPAFSNEPPTDVMDVIKETLPEIMGMILGATVEFTGRLPSVKDSACPACGLSRAEYKKSARFGCAQCYETFAKDLEGLVDDMHRIPHHTGKTPKHPKPSPQASLLMEQLRLAQQEGRQLDAEELKARLSSFGWDTEPPQEIT